MVVTSYMIKPVSNVEGTLLQACRDEHVVLGWGHHVDLLPRNTGNPKRHNAKRHVPGCVRVCLGFGGGGQPAVTVQEQHLLPCKPVVTCHNKQDEDVLLMNTCCSASSGAALCLARFVVQVFSFFLLCCCYYNDDSCPPVPPQVLKPRRGGRSPEG